MFPVRRLAPDGLEASKQMVERGTRAWSRRTSTARMRVGRRGGGFEGEGAGLVGR